MRWKGTVILFSVGTSFIGRSIMIDRNNTLMVSMYTMPNATRLSDPPVRRWKVMPPDVVSSALNTLWISGMSRWWILPSQLGSRTLALMRFWPAPVSTTYTTGRNSKKINSFRTKTMYFIFLNGDTLPLSGCTRSSLYGSSGILFLADI